MGIEKKMSGGMMSDGDAEKGMGMEKNGWRYGRSNYG